MIKIILTVMILSLSPTERKIALVAFLLHADVYRPSLPLGLFCSPHWIQGTIIIKEFGKQILNSLAISTLSGHCFVLAWKM